MRYINENMRFVANLQVHVIPFCALYTDIQSGALFMFVRTTSYSQMKAKYLVSRVTPDRVTQYMGGKIGLSSFLNGGEDGYTYADIDGGHVYLSLEPSFVATDEMKKFDKFDREDCDDSVKLKYFLKRYNQVNG